MQYAILALAAAGYASAQGVAAGTLLPNSSAPAGCNANYNGQFEITIVQAAMAKRDIEKRQSSCSDAGVLVAKLSNGILTDAQTRIGGIVANRQFQFDGPPSQTGTIINGGWSTCNNGSLALGGTTIFYQCLSGGFYNLYDQAVAPQCQQVQIDIIPCAGSSAASSTGASSSSSRASSAATSSSVSIARQSSDGQVTAASATTLRSSTTSARATTVVSQISDGQVQASSAAPRPVSQFSDGQIQATAFATRASTTSVASATRAPVSQISDGQIQATSVATRASSTAVANNTTAAATARFTGGAANFGAEAVIVGGAVAAAFALL